MKQKKINGLTTFRAITTIIEGLLMPLFSALCGFGYFWLSIINNGADHILQRVLISLILTSFVNVIFFTNFFINVIFFTNFFKGINRDNNTKK